MEIEEIISKLIEKKLEEYLKASMWKRIVRDSYMATRESETEKSTADSLCAYRSHHSWGPGEDAKLKRELTAALSRIAVNHGRTLRAIKVESIE